ncbi:HAD-IB family phosphatase [Candidatus Bathyarchaeota archaeon]|nr:HAD-IB family phosphatase [Candidatus Bathyarchaeota archaeon]
MEAQKGYGGIRLVVFDLDGTLTKSPNIWRYLHSKLGTWKYGRVFAKKYLKGEITYREWAELDSRLWRGTGLTEILDATDEIEYTDGAARTLERLREAGLKVGIVSAGLSILADRAGKDLGADAVISNRLIESGGVLTGEIDTRVSVDGKAEIIRDLATSLGISMSEVAVVGDNAFDMPTGAGLKIAFNPRSKEAQDAADFVVRGNDLSAILGFLLPEG